MCCTLNVASSHILAALTACSSLAVTTVSTWLDARNWMSVVKVSGEDGGGWSAAGGFGSVLGGREGR